MTTPDHRPYLREGDLRTVEDAAEWLDGLTSGPARERVYDVPTASALLWERLDRERRQACRRGALDAWRDMTKYVRRARRWQIYPAIVGDEWRCAYISLADCLDYRAAARAK